MKNNAQLIVLGIVLLASVAVFGRLLATDDDRSTSKFGPEAELEAIHDDYPELLSLTEWAEAELRGDLKQAFDQTFGAEIGFRPARVVSTFEFVVSNLGAITVRDIDGTIVQFDVSRGANDEWLVDEVSIVDNEKLTNLLDADDPMEQRKGLAAAAAKYGKD